MKLIAAFLSILVAQSYAHIGETLEEIAVRYGNKVNNINPFAPATIARTYRYQNLLVNVHFQNGKSVAEAYVNNVDRLQPEQLAGIMNANADVKHWVNLGISELGNVWVNKDKQLVTIIFPDSHICMIAEASFLNQTGIFKKYRKPKQTGGF